MRLSDIINEAGNASGGSVTDAGHWRHDQQKFFDVIGLTDRLRRDPVARLGYEIAKNPKTGVIDAISDKGTYYDASAGKGTAGAFRYDSAGSGTIKNYDQSKPATRELSAGSIPYRNVDTSGYAVTPVPDLENYGEILAHELGHVGSMYTNGVATANRYNLSKDEIAKLNWTAANDEVAQRYRDITNTGPGSTQFKDSTSWLAKNVFKTPPTKYDDYDYFAKQIIDRGVPQHVINTATSAMTDLNDPQKLQSYIQDFHGDKTNENSGERGTTNEKIKEHKMRIGHIISEMEAMANPKDRITMDIPLFIRMMEYAREDAKSDMDLHDVAEKAIALMQEHDYLCMDNYDELVSSDENLEEGLISRLAGLVGAYYGAKHGVPDWAMNFEVPYGTYEITRTLLGGFAGYAAGATAGDAVASGAKALVKKAAQAAFNKALMAIRGGEDPNRAWKQFENEVIAANKRSGNTGRKEPTLSIPPSVKTEGKKKITAKDDPCWSGYHMVGTKTKDGREVPNCVPGKKG